MREGLLIVSLAEADAPKVAGTIAWGALGVKRPASRITVGDGMLVCFNHADVSLLSLADPLQPKTLLSQSLSPEDAWTDAIQAATYADGYLYASSYSGLRIYRVAAEDGSPMSCRLVGQRMATPIERTVMRMPQQLRAAGVRRGRPDSAAKGVSRRRPGQHDGVLAGGVLRSQFIRRVGIGAVAGYFGDGSADDKVTGCNARDKGQGARGEGRANDNHDNNDYRDHDHGHGGWRLGGVLLDRSRSGDAQAGDSSAPAVPGQHGAAWRGHSE